MRLNRRRFLRFSSSVSGIACAGALLAACGDGDGGATTPDQQGLQGWTEGQNLEGGQEVQQGQPGGVPDERAQLGLPPGRLVIISLSFEGPDSKIVIENRNTAQDTLFYWILAANGKQWEIPGVFKLQPGDQLTVGYGEGTDTESEVFMNGALDAPDPAGGELGLYNETTDLQDWTYMHQYIQWGAPGQPLAQVAIEGSLWEEGLAVEVADGQTITYDHSQPGQGTFSAS